MKTLYHNASSRGSLTLTWLDAAPIERLQELACNAAPEFRLRT